MITTKWSSAEEALCLALLDTHTASQISEEIYKKVSKKAAGFTERSASAVNRKCLRMGWSPSEGWRQDVPAKTVDEEALQWDTIKEVITKHKTLAVNNTRGVLDPSTITTKILSLSDIHFPFANEACLRSALTAHADADICVLNGDIFEGYAFSHFEKSKSVAALDEYRAAFAFVEMIADSFPKVILVSGNHEARASRSLKDAGLKDASQIFRPDLLARIANGERLDETGKLIEKVDFSNVLYQQSESWYVRIGKALFIHPSGMGGGGTGAMVGKHAKRFNCRYNHDEIDTVVCGHVHKIYKGVVNNQLLIEQGCMADFLDYAWTSKAEFLDNAQNGYAVIYQDKDGNTDFNLSGPVYLGEVLPPKKSII